MSKKLKPKEREIIEKMTKKEEKEERKSPVTPPPLEAKVAEEAVKELLESPTKPETKIIEKIEKTITPAGQQVTEKARAIAHETAEGKIIAKAETTTIVTPSETKPAVEGVVPIELPKPALEEAKAPELPKEKVEKSPREKFFEELVGITTKYANVREFNEALKSMFVKAVLKGVGKIEARDLPPELVDKIISFLRLTSDPVFIPRAIYELRYSPEGKLESEKLIVGNKDLIQELKPANVVTHLQGYVNLDKSPESGTRILFSDRIGAALLKDTNTLVIGRDDKTIKSIVMGRRLRRTELIPATLEKLGIKVAPRRRARRRAVAEKRIVEEALELEPEKLKRVTEELIKKLRERGIEII
ncbi:MAG: hypothetical protein QXX12_00760 [Nanopusillaceae archaeon]